MNNGWIILHRKILDCEIWDSNEPFTRRDAWIELLLLANHRDKSILFNGKPIVIERGQYLTSIRKLAEMFRWSKDKVRRYLRLLEERQMIHKECDKNRTLLTIVNYEVYQDVRDSDKYSDEDSDKHSDKDTDKTQTNKVKKEESGISKDIPQPTQDVQQIIDEWNLLPYPVSKVVKITTTSKRYKEIKARIKEYGVEKVIDAIRNVSTSDFLMGESSSGWVISFDWFVSKNNFHKVLEGNYKNRTKSPQYTEYGERNYLKEIQEA